MRRPRPAVIVLAVVAFLAISVELARFLTGVGEERSQILAVLAAQARGDAQGVLAHLDACDARCQAAVRDNVVRLRRVGEVKILNLRSGAGVTFSSSEGLSRVAWENVGHGDLPVVQCVRVRRHWDFLSGASTTLLAIGRPIGNTADC